MKQFVKDTAEIAALTAELIGVGLLVILSILALARGVVDRFRGGDPAKAFSALRRRLGRGILMGLEFLVAADIIHTVVIQLTMEAVAVLAGIVLIRTFLSFALEVEITGKWPWQGEGKPLG